LLFHVYRFEFGEALDISHAMEKYFTARPNKLRQSTLIFHRYYTAWIHFAQQDYKAVAALYKDTGVTDGATAQTLLRIATSLRKLGNEPEGLRLLERGSEAHSGDPAMFVALADYYTQMGESAKASAALQKSKTLAVVN